MNQEGHDARMAGKNRRKKLHDEHPNKKRSKLNRKERDAIVQDVLAGNCLSEVGRAIGKDGMDGTNAEISHDAEKSEASQDARRQHCS